MKQTRTFYNQPQPHAASKTRKTSGKNKILKKIYLKKRMANHGMCGPQREKERPHTIERHLDAWLISL